MVDYLRSLPNTAIIFLAELLFIILHRSNNVDLVGLYFMLLSSILSLSKLSITGQNKWIFYNGLIGMSIEESITLIV